MSLVKSVVELSIENRKSLKNQMEKGLKISEFVNYDIISLIFIAAYLQMTTKIARKQRIAPPQTSSCLREQREKERGRIYAQNSAVLLRACANAPRDTRASRASFAPPEVNRRQDSD